MCTAVLKMDGTKAGPFMYRAVSDKRKEGTTMDFISYTFVNAVISALAVFGCWLILRPQKIENRALHKSIDNNTKALEDLTGLINEMRVAQASVETNITNLWHRYKDLKGEVDKIHDHNRNLGNTSCSKK